MGCRADQVCAFVLAALTYHDIYYLRSGKNKYLPDAKVPNINLRSQANKQIYF